VQLGPSAPTIVVGLLAAVAAACSDGGGSPESASQAFCRLPEAEVEARVDDLLSQMTLEEKVEQMAGTGALGSGGWLAPANERLGIPGFAMIDGPRGVSVLGGHATAFPVAMARGASWDPELERRVGEAIGAEARAKGASVLLAPTINLLRHPGWGRAQETYGEDTHHLSRFAVAFVEGAQQHVIASAKHFALNSIEDTRFTVNVTTDERTLREIYLPQFRAAVQEAHVGSVMSAYNRVDGAYCAENSHLLRDILKGDWGFRGFVESDWILGTRSTVASARSGLDIEMPSPSFYGAKLIAAVEAGEVPMDDIDEAARRVLRTKLCFELDSDPPVPDPAVVESADHTALALDAEREAIVLLANRNAALPLERSALGSLVVIGPLADSANIGDTGSSNVNPSYVVTPLAGIASHAGSAQVVFLEDDGSSAASQNALAAADAAVVVVGLTAADEGEGGVSGGDRHTLALSAEQEALIQRVADSSRRTIVVLEGGSAITVEPWIDRVDAVLMAWYPGQEGGNAIAEVLFGDVNPSGKLPFTVPHDESDLPEFVSDPARLDVTYGFLHGYRWIDAQGIEPRFPFGFGLSYTSFTVANLTLDGRTLAPGGVLGASVDVTNTGARSGDEIVQLYVGFEGSRVERPRRQLAAFARVHLEAGETRRVPLEIAARDIAYYDVAQAEFVLEPITYVVQVGESSRDLPLEARFRVR